MDEKIILKIADIDINLAGGKTNPEMTGSLKIKNLEVTGVNEKLAEAIINYLQKISE